jgi:phosphoesterase RecJ-like protein
MTAWSKIMSLIQDYQQIILLLHEKPDGDCLGSALALGLHLQSEGFQPLIYHPEKINREFSFLPGQDLIKYYTKQVLPEKPVIAVDCAAENRLLYTLPQNVPIINIDHHQSNTFFGDYNLVEPKAAAAGEIIFKLLQNAQKSISAEMATCLYVAVATDTGYFRHSNTTAETFFIAGKLLNYGAAVDLIREHLFEKRPFKELKIIKIALDKLQFAQEKRIVWTVLSYEDLAANGLLNIDTEKIISLLRSVAGVQVALVFKELEPRKIKVSLRGKQGYDVNLLAQHFNGGGHAQAAGCSLEGNLKESVNLVIKKTADLLEKL